MALKKVRAAAFVDAMLATTATLTFTDLETGEPKTDDFKIIYFALSPKKADELDRWIEDYDRRLEALEARRQAHEAAQAKERQAAEAAGGTFEERPFEDPEEDELKHGLAQLVAKMVKSIPEIVEGEGEEERPIAITAETLSGFAAQNLRSIRDAIRRDAATDPARPTA